MGRALMSRHLFDRARPIGPGAAAVAALTLSGILLSATGAVRVSADISSGGQAGEVDLAKFASTYCAGCHNDRLKTGGLSLEDPALADPAAHPELWEKVLHKISTGQMPPARMPRPEPAAFRRIVAHIETTHDRAAAEHPDFGRVGAHRLNRTEYGNTVRDLLGITIDTSRALLPDEADEGFDNVAVSLALSPAHLERYLNAAREVSRLAVGDPSIGDAVRSATYRVPRLLEQDVRLGDDLPFGSRGGVAIRHQFPLNGEYTFKIRLRRQVYDYIVGMGSAQDLDLRIDGKRITRFRVGGEAQGTPGPMTWNGEIVGDTPYELYMHAADAGLEARATVTAGEHLVSASFVEAPWEPEGVQQPLQVDFGRGSDEQFDGVAAVDALTINGPYTPAGSGDTASRRLIFSCRPSATADEPACARRILTRLARRAYRRPPTAEEVDTLLGFFTPAAKERGFDAGIQSAIERMLVSFNFLFRIEREPAAARDGMYRLADLDLASRLSFFLWNSIPDDTLLTLAERNRLHEPEILAQQTMRMLRDPKADALVTGFANQWLGIRKAQSFLPDPNIFPEFDENLRRALQRETQLFVQSQIDADRSIVDLVTADYSFVNERVAQHYGVRGVAGDRFRRYRFTDGIRGGILGQGTVLMSTSYPDRTAPVVRGFWVLETLLGMPPPPPPPDIPDLQTTSADGRPLSMRAQMERHRASPSCSVCHVRMDPLGFSMENFDAIGRWRTMSGGVPVDAASVFPDGTPINGVAGLRDFVVRHQDSYVHTFVSKMLTYALGRHVDYRDQPVIRGIMRGAAASRYRWSAIIQGIVSSQPFLMGRTTS
jgi:mono/diheme cytochrome c family protein